MQNVHVPLLNVLQPAVQYKSSTLEYTVYHKKDPFLFIFIICSNYEQFTQSLYQ